MTRYRTIVADPPWSGGVYTRPAWAWRVGRPSGQTRALDYPTMTDGEIAALPVRDMSDNVGADAHLYLWTTSHHLHSAFDIARGWGFHYAATLVWCKAPRGFGPGGTFQNNVEFIIFAKRPAQEHRLDYVHVTTFIAAARDSSQHTNREIDALFGFNGMASHWTSRDGMQAAVPTVSQWRRLQKFLGFGQEMDAEVERINAAKGTVVDRTPQSSTSRWFQWPRGSHSTKPDAFLDLVEQVSPGPYLELFARRQRLGWDTWGDEALEHVELPS